MPLVTGLVLGLVGAVSIFLGVRGIGSLVRKKWRLGTVRVLTCLGGLVLTVALLAVFAYALVPAALGEKLIEPSQKARVLAESISTLMNCSVWGPLIGLLAGVVASLRDLRQSRHRAVEGDGPAAGKS